MKKLLILGFAVTVCCMFGGSKANAQTAQEHSLDVKPPSSKINNIDVPFRVLEYAQMKYQGHAVTHVDPVFHGSEIAYRLRVDRDDIPDDFNSYFLTYDKKWNLLDDQKATKPAQSRYTAPIPTPQSNTPQPADRDNDRKPNRDVRSEQPRQQPDTSGDDDDTPDPIEPEEPDGNTQTGPKPRGRGRH